MKQLLLIAIALASSVRAADEAPQLPPSAQAIVDRAERVITANRAAYDAANKKPLADAGKALKTKQAELAKSGELEEALAIKKALELFGDELVARVDEKANTNGDFPKPAKITRTLLIGKWKQNNGTVYEFRRTGALLCWWNAAHHDAGMAHEASGTWTCDSTSAGFDLAGRRYTIQSGADTELSVTDITGGGVPYSIVKIVMDEEPAN